MTVCLDEPVSGDTLGICVMLAEGLNERWSDDWRSFRPKRIAEKMNESRKKVGKNIADNRGEYEKKKRDLPSDIEQIHGKDHKVAREDYDRGKVENEYACTTVSHTSLTRKRFRLSLHRPLRRNQRRWSL